MRAVGIYGGGGAILYHIIHFETNVAFIECRLPGTRDSYTDSKDHKPLLMVKTNIKDNKIDRIDV